MEFRTYESLTHAAARTGLSVQDLRRRIAAGELDPYRSGPRILHVDPLDVNLLRCQRQPLASIKSNIEAKPVAPGQQPWPGVRKGHLEDCET
jgi:hypothetical protein